MQAAVGVRVWRTARGLVQKEEAGGLEKSACKEDKLGLASRARDARGLGRGLQQFLVELVDSTLGQLLARCRWTGHR